jgi:hypothetical protein
MSARPHDWLQLDRVSRRWRDPDPATDAPSTIAPSPDAPSTDVPSMNAPDDPLKWAARLRELGHARYGAGTPIARVIDELCRLTAARFNPPADGAEDAAALDAEIEAYVGHVEDLADVARLRAGR